MQYASFLNGVAVNLAQSEICHNNEIMVISGDDGSGETGPVLDLAHLNLS
jgi:hypothetical protein